MLKLGLMARVTNLSQKMILVRKVEFILGTIKNYLFLAPFTIIFHYFSPLVINQVYNAEITPNEYVMRGNAAIIKCLIPSFVTDFVQVIAWINEEGEEFKIENDFSDGIMLNFSEFSLILYP